MYVSTSSVEAQLAPPAQPYPHHVSGIPDDVAAPALKRSESRPQAGSPDTTFLL